MWNPQLLPAPRRQFFSSPVAVCQPMRHCPLPIREITVSTATTEPEITDRIRKEVAGILGAARA
jgi:hypothetical protein